MMARTFRPAVTVLLLGILLVGLFILFTRLVENLVLEDFTYTFYRSAQYAFRGENVYVNDYGRPLTATQYPPYNPIWILYALVPLSVLPLDVATTVRFLLDLMAIPFLAYACAQWARLKSPWRVGLLAIAPWFSIMIYAGQWVGLVLLGALLCYWGLARASAAMIAVGIWLVAINPNFTLLVILATLIYAYRNRMLVRVIGMLAAWTALFSIAQPTWVLDLLRLYLNRVAHPQPADSVLLLPGWPWAQLTLSIAGIVFLVWYVWKRPSACPPRWLWGVLVCVSLIGAFHEYTYDWIVLMIPLAWLLRDSRAIVLTLIFYSYPLVWAFLQAMFSISIPPPTLIPVAILIAVLVFRFWMPDKQFLKEVTQ
jgi:hypothetical protein